MAQVYGKSGAEQNLIQNSLAEINCFDDIQSLSTKYKNDLVQAKKIFFDNLPTLILRENNKLEEFKIQRVIVEEDWDKKINSIRSELELYKLRVWKYVDIFIKTRFSKPKAIKKADINIVSQKDFIDKLENEPNTVFADEQVELIQKINHLERNINSADYSGAIGEIQVLNELKKLDDSYYIFCDKKLRLRDYVRYRGRRNLRSAQMDFIVVGPTGIFVIEVKNWGSNQLNHHTGISPYEQVDRAGLVLWIYLKQRSFFYKPRITKLIVPIQHNIGYNPNYKSVLIRGKESLLKFINGNNNTLSHERVNKITSILMR